MSCSCHGSITSLLICCTPSSVPEHALLPLQYSNLYLLAMCRTNVNATAMLLFLHRLLDVFKHYFSEMEEESLRDNFVIAYELLDEVMDFGYPQVRLAWTQICRNLLRQALLQPRSL